MIHVISSSLAAHLFTNSRPSEKDGTPTSLASRWVEAISDSPAASIASQQKVGRLGGGERGRGKKAGNGKGKWKSQ